jgi:hypothetical protein
MLWAVSLPAKAHGQEILTSIYAELVSITICVAILFFNKKTRPYRLPGLTACILGVVFENFALSNLPYRQYQHLITILGFTVPLTVTALAVYISHLIESRKK